VSYSWSVPGYLAHTRTVISREASRYLVGCWSNIAQTHAIKILRLCSHPRDGEDLLVLVDTLLELSEEHSET
jgi:hypothetical protein